MFSYAPVHYRCALWARIYIPFALLLALFLFGCPPPDPSDTSGEDLNAPTTLTGTVNARNVMIPENTITTVTGDVEIVATGDVTIAGTLAAEPSEGDGYNISIRADGNIVIEGTIEAGAAAENAGVKASYAEGMDGGSIYMRCKGDIFVGRYSNLLAQIGTTGSSGPNPAPGGKGGILYFEAEGGVSVYGRLFVGNGGWGGDASDTLLNAREEYSGRGGDSGFIYLETSYGEVDWPGFDTELWAIDVAYYNASETGGLRGGLGGYGGRVDLYSDAFDCGSIVGPATNMIGTTTIRAAKGGRGWSEGGNGGSILIDGTCYWRNLDGVDLEGIAGDGGDLIFNESSVLVPELTVKRLFAKGGNGGDAQVSTSNGRLSGTHHLAGGRGGNAVARGGRGGGTFSLFLHSGGNGGNARALGGGGGEGWGLECDDLEEAGGVGGAGGNSEAYAGDGGDGLAPGTGGAASVFEFAPFSAGANGGRGVPGGAGGAAGNWTISDGRAGTTDTSEERDPVITVSGKGVAGAEGILWNPNIECSR